VTRTTKTRSGCKGPLPDDWGGGFLFTHKRKVRANPESARWERGSLIAVDHEIESHDCSNSCSLPRFSTRGKGAGSELRKKLSSCFTALTLKVIPTTRGSSALPRYAAVNRLASLIDPKKVVYGGKFDAQARYLDPSILYPVSWSDKIMEDEIFGPLLPILTYSDLGELLAMIKSLPKPLAGYVFSQDRRAIDRVLQSLSFGGGAMNQTNIFLFIESMPYAGVGTSGIRNYYGKYGYDSLTHAKSVLISPPDVAIDHLFPPYSREKVQALNQWFDY
jgi:aldehyde dehydrogenase (NAD+)